MSEPVKLRALVVAGSLIATAAVAHADVSPHRSENFLPSSNGMAAIAWDRSQNKLDQWLEHPYQALNGSTLTRNFLYDSYPGLRINGTGTWLNSVAPILIEYVPGTGIVHTARMMGTLLVDEYDFTPMDLAEYASVMLVKVTQTGAQANATVDAYSIFNYHLGSGSPTPGTDSETITYDPWRESYYESGPSGVAFGYRTITTATHHGCTPNNPFALLNSGSNLDDDAGTGGAINDASAGFQTSLGTIATGASVWVGWTTVLAADANAQDATDRVTQWSNGRTADQLLADEITGWQAWITPAPSGATPLEAAQDLQAQVAIRMGQVTEAGTGNGQILASVAPGTWNISWVRDMAYAVVGLIRSGHFAEAKAAIAFQLQATVGAYQQFVGSPYQISVVRYYGDGSEWSDANNDGPNIEFDGFGLFLWELDQYVAASGDTASLTQWWPTVKSKIADVLVNLQQSNGLIAPDSSIWEVHWDGQEKHFAFTTITAANGLCSASRVAQAAGDTSSVATYLAAGQKSRDALLPNLRAPDGSLLQSTEALAAGGGWLDAATIEAINFGLIDPTLHTATATLADLQRGLVPQSGRGFMRSDAGDDYSSHDWVFVDLRAARALELHGDAETSADLFAWNVAQGSDNFGELSELHDPVTGDYAGQAPMVGFGGGAYLLALADRGTANTPSCNEFASEPANPSSDGGIDAGVGGGDAGIGSGGGGGCNLGGNAGGGVMLLIAILYVMGRRSVQRNDTSGATL